LTLEIENADELRISFVLPDLEGSMALCEAMSDAKACYLV